MKSISLQDLTPYIGQAKKEGILFSENCYYFGYYIKDESDEQEQLAGFCAVKISGKKAIFKCDYVLPEYRRLGIHSKMMRIRLEIVKAQNINIVEANCTKMSIGSYLKYGAKIIKEYKNGITQVRFENLSK